MRRGGYVLCPGLEVDVKGAWIAVGDLMELSSLYEAIGPDAAPIARWMSAARAA